MSASSRPRGSSPQPPAAPATATAVGGFPPPNFALRCPSVEPGSRFGAVVKSALAAIASNNSNSDSDGRHHSTNTGGNVDDTEAIPRAESFESFARGWMRSYSTAFSEEEEEEEEDTTYPVSSGAGAGARTRRRIRSRSRSPVYQQPDYRDDRYPTSTPGLGSATLHHHQSQSHYQQSPYPHPTTHPRYDPEIIPAASAELLALEAASAELRVLQSELDVVSTQLSGLEGWQARVAAAVVQRNVETFFDSADDGVRAVRDGARMERTRVEWTVERMRGRLAELRRRLELRRRQGFGG
ncbi:hypothetical protein B0T19DRAFT_483865 [Cercophora scortea]|uniref:Uncharacterized protein n=1 Tax=Cercophora scortea TaxID=314031 RepID=A0AAE0J0I4_9PEZI|nr:hypothetical protein B0T19DRAFT_483865 [Cercophora scortea]